MKWCENDNAVNMDWTQKQMLWLEEHDLLIVWLIFILNAFIYGVRKLATEKCTCFLPSNGDSNRNQTHILAHKLGEHVVSLIFEKII